MASDKVMDSDEEDIFGPPIDDNDDDDDMPRGGIYVDETQVDDEAGIGKPLIRAKQAEQLRSSRNDDSIIELQKPLLNGAGGIDNKTQIQVRNPLQS